jgi:hypothetical protein
LQHPEAQVRGQVVRVLGRIKASEAAVQIMGLTNDKEEFLYCADGKLVSTTVSEQAAIAIQAIHEGKNDE